MQVLYFLLGVLIGLGVVLILWLIVWGVYAAIRAWLQPAWLFKLTEKEIGGGVARYEQAQVLVRAWTATGAWGYAQQECRRQENRNGKEWRVNDMHRV